MAMSVRFAGETHLIRTDTTLAVATVSEVGGG
jgi:hypothetical protein